MKRYIKSSIEQSNNTKASSTEGYVYTYCDECGKKNRVKVTFNNFNEPFNDTEYKCKYCGTNNLLTDPHSYDENGNVVEASQSFLDRIEELMEQGLDEETASREAYAEFYPDEYDSDDYDEIYSANYGGAYYVEVNSTQRGTAPYEKKFSDFNSALSFAKKRGNSKTTIYIWDIPKEERSSNSVPNAVYNFDSGWQIIRPVNSNEDRADDEIYSSTTSSSRYWYFTRHGVQPGSVPKYVNILDIIDTPEGSYFLADGVILTKDLRYYDIKERKPEDSVTSSTRIKSKGNNQYTDADLQDIAEKIQSSSSVVTAASSGKLDKYMNVTKDRKKYAVHYTEVNTEQDAWTIYSDFRAQVSKIAPYDDADYAWADIRNGHIDVIRNGKVVKRSYYFNADDMDVENTEWCDIIIDEAIDLIAKINKDIEPRMVYNSTSVETSADTKLESYRRRVYSKIYHFMTDRLGFDLTEVADYVTVDCTESEDSRIKIEVRAELDYDDMWELKTVIDPVVENIDKNAYFDFEYPGVLVAYVSSKPANSRYVHAADEPEHKTEPDDEYEPEEVDEDVTVEFDMDRVRIDVDKSGYWEYIDDSFLDAVMTDDTLYSEEYDVKVRDRNGLLEDLDDILKYDIPVEAGEYRISCHITLVYHITGIEKYDEYPDDNYGDSSEYSTENAEVKFDFHDSYVEDFRIVD